MTSTQPIALVTGGAGLGIGRGICSSVAADGWHVVVADVDEDGASAAAAELRAAGHSASAARLDVASADSISEVVDRVGREHGTITGLVNSAGVGLVAPLATVTVDQWDRLHGIDLRGAFLVSRAVIPGMIAAGGGSIVNIGSIQAHSPHVGYGAYAAAKAGLIGLTRGIAADHGGDGVRCSIVHPGMVDSPQTRDILAQWGDPEEWIEDYLATRQMLPAAVSPSDVGDAVAYLLRARSTTAVELVVDGGSSRMAFDKDPE